MRKHQPMFKAFVCFIVDGKCSRCNTKISEETKGKYYVASCPKCKVVYVMANTEAIARVVVKDD